MKTIKYISPYLQQKYRFLQEHTCSFKDKEAPVCGNANRGVLVLFLGEMLGKNFPDRVTDLLSGQHLFQAAVD